MQTTRILENRATVSAVVSALTNAPPKLRWYPGDGHIFLLSGFIPAVNGRPRQRPFKG